MSQALPAAMSQVGLRLKIGEKRFILCRRPTCDLVASNAWDTVPIYEYIRRRLMEPSQIFAAGMPAKLDSSQLRRCAGG